MIRDRALVAAMCSVLRRVVFVKGEVLAREGEVVREMFFLEAGRVKQEREADDDEDEEEEEAVQAEAREGEREHKGRGLAARGADGLRAARREVGGARGLVRRRCMPCSAEVSELQGRLD